MKQKQIQKDFKKKIKRRTEMETSTARATVRLRNSGAESTISVYWIRLRQVHSLATRVPYKNTITKPHAAGRAHCIHFAS